VGQVETDVAANLARVRERIDVAASRAARSPGEVRLIAVSKNHPSEAILAAVAAGQRRFGENTVQEALPKITALADRSLEWHFIGHLQSNKARHVPGHFRLLHSLDSLKLAQRLSRFAVEQRVTLDALIEVNVTRDPAKHGVAPEAVAPLVESILRQSLPALKLRGLMAIGPYPADELTLRASFAMVRRLREDCVSRYALSGFNELSMGMSNDYPQAIAEGSTLVRIGTAIFGERHYT